jgi:hypothetical protein
LSSRTSRVLRLPSKVTDYSPVQKTVCGKTATVRGLRMHAADGLHIAATSM